MGTASEAIPTQSGILTVRMLGIVLPCCSTYLNKDTSLTKNKQSMLFTVAVAVDLSLMEAIVGVN